jgi:HSP20 family protein
MLVKWDAAATLDRMFDDVMGSMLGAATNSQSFNLALDVLTTNDELVVTCDVPGVKSEDLEITLENHVLTIKGARNWESKESEESRHMVLGRSYGAFARSITLPQYLDEEKLEASLSDGVLRIRIPKHPKAKPVKIAISTQQEKQLKE